MLDLYVSSYQEAVQTFAVEQQGRRRRDEYTSGAIRTLIDAFHYQGTIRSKKWQISYLILLNLNF
ncbi:MAG: hypothetical protein CM15mV118_400 [uncultured marine virus]|nr:MAG: hypothetical protein CM15mV118_400 [uncultured marine virus]